MEHIEKTNSARHTEALFIRILASQQTIKTLLRHTPTQYYDAEHTGEREDALIALYNQNNALNK